MAVNAKGTVFKFTPPGGTQATVGCLVSVGGVTPDSEEIDVTTLDSAGGYREYMQGYRDAGSVTREGYHDKTDAGQTAIREAYASGKAGSAQIVFSDGAKVSFSAFVKSYTLGAAEVDGAVGFSAELRITGAVTYAAI